MGKQTSYAFLHQLTRASPCLDGELIELKFLCRRQLNVHKNPKIASNC